MFGNTLGGIIGIGIFTLLSKVLKGRTNKVINVLAAACTVWHSCLSLCCWPATDGCVSNRHQRNDKMERE